MRRDGSLSMRQDQIDDAVIEASRLYREAIARRVKAIRALQKGEAFK